MLALAACDAPVAAGPESTTEQDVPRPDSVEAGGSAAQVGLETASEPDDSPLGHTGTPAQPTSEGPIAERSEVLALRDRRMAEGPACDIAFTYAGHPPQRVIWEEACDAVTARIMRQEDLERYNRWERIDDYGRKAIAERTGGEVLYVGGTFSAAVYPIDYNHLPFEIAVAD